jgi:hypothetical protein
MASSDPQSDIANKKPRLGMFSSAAPKSDQPKANVPDVTVRPSSTLVQMLSTFLFKSTRASRFAMMILSKAEEGPLKSIRKTSDTSTVPGLPFTFAYPNVTFEGERRPASKFSFMGYLELNKDSPAPGVLGDLMSPSPSLKAYGSNLYADTEENTVVPNESTVAQVSIGAAWSTLDLAKAALVANTEAFFNTLRFQQVVQQASLDTTFKPIESDTYHLYKTSQGIQCNTTPSKRAYSGSLSRFVVVLNPPPESKFGARVVGVSGGTRTERGSTRPLKLTLAWVCNPTTQRDVTMWTSDAAAMFGESDKDALFARLKTESVLLLVTGVVSSDESNVELTVRAASMPVDTSSFLAFESNVFKSLFNDLINTRNGIQSSGLSKLTYESSAEAILNSGGAVPLAAQRVSASDSGPTDALMLRKDAVVQLVRDIKVHDEADDDTKAILDIVAKSDDEKIVKAVDALDKAANATWTTAWTQHGRSMDDTRDEIVEALSGEGDDDNGDVDHDMLKIALVALTAFERIEAAQLSTLQPMVKRTKVMPTTGASTEAVNEVVVEDDDDLCNGL